MSGAHFLTTLSAYVPIEMGAHAGAQADCYAEMHNIIIIISYSIDVVDLSSK